MADDRIITLRFKPKSVPDMELYRNLETEKKRLGLSMPAYVKNALRQNFESRERMWTDGSVDVCMERIREIVHGELALHSAAVSEMLGKMTGGAANGIGKAEWGKTPDQREKLPEYSDNFPEGLNGVLEKFM
ncbi:MAG: hypothetical protein HFI78_09190 [Lachnospiraceae bacterium]|jgi:hypothetical protein|nr:hypothetical protein [Lachnospiraceae bacterium]